MRRKIKRWRRFEQPVVGLVLWGFRDFIAELENTDKTWEERIGNG